MIELDILVPNIKLGFITVSSARIPISGLTLAHVFEPLQVEAPRHLVEGAQSWEAFRLGLAEGQGLDLPLPVGRLAFFNEQGILVVTVPAVAQAMLTSWAPYQDGPPTSDGASVTGRYQVRRGLRGSISVLGRTIEIRAPE